MTENKPGVNHPRLFVHLPYEDFTRYSRLLIEHGQQPELYISAAVLDGEVDALPAAEVGSRLRDLGMSCTVHAPYLDMAPGSADAQFRSVTFRRLAAALDMTARLGGQVLVAHAGFDTRRQGYMIDEWLARAAETWRAVGDLAAERGVLLALENVYEYDPRPLTALLSQLDHPAVAGCFDVGHVACFSRTPMETWLAEFGPFIRHLHLHDNRGQQDDHWGLGRGSISLDPLHAFLQAGGPPLTMTIEGHGLDHVIASVAYIEQRGWLVNDAG